VAGAFGDEPPEGNEVVVGDARSGVVEVPTCSIYQLTTDSLVDTVVDAILDGEHQRASADASKLLPEGWKLCEDSLALLSKG